VCRGLGASFEALSFGLENSFNLICETLLDHIEEFPKLQQVGPTDCLSTAGFARMVERTEAELAFKAHPHMLRHACGYALANKGHDTRAVQAYLGHRNIQHTVRYTELVPTRFKDFWRR
jgi:site-specific recombinase XerD